MSVNKQVKTIPATRTPFTSAPITEQKKRKVAGYARVSTDHDEQFTSYEAQIDYYTKYIKAREDWEFVKVYTDEGITGTSTRHREGFKQMIADALDGKIDLIVTKSVSRFARNTVDSLSTIRQLKDKGVEVYFEKENINTMDAKGEVLLTIMASLAQQESQSLSQNVRLGLQYRYQQGKVQVCTNRFLGYDKDEDGNLVINPEEAEVVRRIYREYLEGESYYEIGKRLTADGIKTAAGSERWLASTLRKILMNEKYIGDALLQKTVTTDFLTKKRVVNKGIVPQYYVEGCHEAIIPREIYMQVQEEIARRANIGTATGKRRVYSGKHALSSFVYCSHCGDIYRRISWNNRGKKTVVWRCVSRVEKKKSNICCPARTVSEEDLHAVVVMAVNYAFKEKEVVIASLKTSIQKVLIDENDDIMNSIDEELEKLQRELLNKASAKQEYGSLVDKIESLKENKRDLLLASTNHERSRQRIEELEEFLDAQETEVSEYDEILVKKLIEKITVYDDHFMVEFKSGLEIDVVM